MSIVEQIEITQFRNIEQIQIKTHPKLNFFHGANAQGKTSLLEAIYFCCELKSFRILDPASLIRRGFDESALKIYLNDEGLENEISVYLSPEKKEVFLNLKPLKTYKKLRELLPIILFTPESVRLFKVSPFERRAYFDSFFSLISPLYSNTLSQYQKIYKQKAQFLENCELRSPESIEIEIWNEKLSELSSHLSLLRFEFTQKLHFYFSSLFNELSFSQWQSLLSYSPYLGTIHSQLNFDQIFEIYKMEMKKRFFDEKTRKQVLVGIHRDDWQIYLNDSKLKEEGSQGQHRVAVSSLKLSQIALLQELSFKPIALFDDLFSELDEKRSSGLLTKLFDYPCQIFFNSTQSDPGFDALKKGYCFHIENGKIMS